MSGFVELTSELNAGDFQNMITGNISLWSCVPDEYKVMWRKNAKESFYNFWVSLADETMVFDWVLEARRDLIGVLDSADGQKWFKRTFDEIHREILAA